jgi:hypothetical protein
MATAFLGAISGPTVAHAASTLGNVTFTAAEVFKDVSIYGKTNFGPGSPAGSNTVLFIHGYLLVMASNDSGKPPGVFNFFDVSDPRKPVLVKSYSSAQSANNRELHAMPMAIIDGKFIVATPTTKGVCFYDFTDIMNPKDVGTLALNGVSGGDYTNVAWELSWSWPYLYVGSSGSGIDIVDATDPSAAKLVKNIPTGQLGNFRVGPVHAAGVYLTAASMDQDPTKVSILDVTDPTNPSLLTTGSVKSMYSSLTIGDMIYGVGVGANYSFMKWTPDAITVIGSKQIGKDKGGYCTYQDGFGFCGQSSDGFHKLDLHTYTLDGIKEVGVGKPAGGDTTGAGDFDFATVVGNMVYLGNDHGTGASLIPHQMEKDTTPPDVLKVYPED